MARTYDFYERLYSIGRQEILCIEGIIKQFEKGIVNEKALRSLGLNGLIYCVAEGKFDTLKRLIGPIGVKKKDGSVEYKYYMDAISLGLVEYMNGLPSSIMERYAKIMREEAETNPSLFKVDPSKGKLTEDELRERELLHSLFVKRASQDAVVLSKSERAAIDKVLYDINMGVVGKIKIKDVHARQISGMAHPIRDRKGVAHYSEISNYLPCLALFNMNICTTSNDTVGCVDDIPTEECKCEISIHYDSLSEENKCVADALVESGHAYLFESFKGDGQDLMISVSCSADETILDVNKRFMKLIAKFTKQDVLYGIIKPEDIVFDISRWYEYVENQNSVSIISELLKGPINNDVINQMLSLCKSMFPYVYDKDEDKFYEDPEIYEMHKQYLIESLFSNGDGSVTL